MTEHERQRLDAAVKHPSPENIEAVHVAGRSGPPLPSAPKGHRWMSVRTDGRITGWRLSTAGEEHRFARIAAYAWDQSDFETNVTNDADIEEAFRR